MVIICDRNKQFQAFELKEKLQEKLKKSREEAEERKKEVEQLQSKVSRSNLSNASSIIFIVLQITEGALLMEGEEEILKGTVMKYFELFPERNYKQGIHLWIRIRFQLSIT